MHFACRIVFFMMGALACSTTCWSQGYNSCGVTASFTPNNDSILSGSFNVNFTSTGTNATSYSWYINGSPDGNGPVFNFNNTQPGLYEIKLVAQNGSCTDTSLCYYYYPGSQPANRDNIRAYYSLSHQDNTGTALIAAANGGYLMGGTTTLGDYPSGKTFGSVIKTNEAGCAEWAKLSNRPTLEK